MSTSRRLLQEVKAIRILSALGVLLALVMGGLVILQAQKLSSLINGVFLGKQTLEVVTPVFRILLLIILLRAVLTFLNGSVAGLLAAKMKDRLRRLLLEKVSRLGPAFTAGETTGELTTTALQGIEALDAYFSQYLPQILVAALLPLLILIVVFPLDLLTGVVFLVTAPLIPFFMWLVGRASENETRRQWLALTRLGSYFLDTLQGMTTLKALGQSKARTQRISDVSEQYRETTLGVLRITFLSALTLELLATLSTAVVAVEIGLRLLYSKIAFEQAFFILLLAPEFYLPLRMLGARFHAGMRGVSAAKRIYEVFDAPEPCTSMRSTETGAMPDLLGRFQIRFDSVTFNYPNRTQDSLKDLNLTIEAGRVYGLIGPSGAGKSTLMQLLLRFIEVKSGTITLNGMDFYSLPVGEWRRQISWVPQKPALLDASVLENIRLSKPEAALDEVRWAADKARLDHFVMALPQKYDTRVFELGSRVSSGQAQRIALARAFLKDAPFVLMDEPTSHLDIELEQELNQVVHRLLEQRTALVIAHRLSTVKNAHHLFLLDQGHLVGSGSHTELLSASALYRSLFESSGGGR